MRDLVLWRPLLPMRVRRAERGLQPLGSAFRAVPDDLLWTIDLLPEEARRGVRFLLPVRAVATCRSCGGRLASCRQCAGRGLDVIIREVPLAAPPGVTDGTVLIADVGNGLDQVRASVRVRWQ